MSKEGSREFDCGDGFVQSLLENAGHPEYSGEQTVGEVFINGRTGLRGLVEDVEKHYLDRPTIFKKIRDSGKEILAHATSYGRTALVGHPNIIKVSAVTAVALGTGAIILAVKKRRTRLKKI